MSAPTLKIPKSLAAAADERLHVGVDKVTGDKLVQGPAVGIPPKHLVAQPVDSHEVATGFERAQREIREEPGSVSSHTPGTPSEATVTDQYAVAFDIDGVLIRGGKPIPEAAQAMRMLNGENEYGVKV